MKWPCNNKKVTNNVTINLLSLNCFASHAKHGPAGKPLVAFNISLKHLLAVLMLVMLGALTFQFQLRPTRTSLTWQSQPLTSGMGTQQSIKMRHSTLKAQPRVQTLVEPSSVPNYSKGQWSGNKTLDSLTTVFIMSGRGNFAAREAIRQSWALGETNAIFVIGGRPCDVPPAFQSVRGPCQLDQSALVENYKETLATYNEEQTRIKANLAKELEVYNDILLLDSVDSYGNLAEKTLGIIEWSARHQPGRWLFKVDDDAVVNIKMLENHLTSLDPSEMRIIGSFEKASPVLNTTKWAEFQYKEKFYPPYPQGSTGYILSPPLVRILASNANEFTLFHNEDASLGIWMSELGLTNKTVTFDEDPRILKEWLYDWKKCLMEQSFSRKFVYSHGFTPKQIIKCYDYLVHVEAKSKRYTIFQKVLSHRKQQRGPELGKGANQDLVLPRTKSGVFDSLGFVPHDATALFVNLVTSQSNERFERHVQRQAWNRFPCSLEAKNSGIQPCLLMFFIQDAPTNQLEEEGKLTGDLILHTPSSAEAEDATNKLELFLKGTEALLGKVTWFVISSPGTLVHPERVSQALLMLSQRSADKVIVSDAESSKAPVLQDATFILSSSLVRALHAVLQHPKVLRRAQRMSFESAINYCLRQVDQFSMQRIGNVFASAQRPCKDSECCSRQDQLSFGPGLSGREVWSCSTGW